LVFSSSIYKYPYKFIWHLLSWIGKNSDVVCYCAEPLDYLVFENIKPYLRSIPVVGKRKTRIYLKLRNIECKRMPSFPRFVIMFRHAAHKFPERKIQKIGFRHGAYNFKKYTKAVNYNEFTVFLTTSQSDVKIAENLGCKTVKSIGAPKIDPLFNGKNKDKMLEEFRKKAKINPNKKTIILTTTYDGSGMSAIEHWINKLDILAEKYNVLATAHPWISKKYLKRLKIHENIYFIEDINTLPFLALSELMVGDYSSIMGEYCSLDRPIVTFKVKPGKRAIPQIIDLISKISIQVETFDELLSAVERSLTNPKELSQARQEANRIMFDQLDGRAGLRAAKVITELLPQLKIDSD